MFFSQCSQYCETGMREKISVCGDATQSQFSWAESVSVLPPGGKTDGCSRDEASLQDQEISALTYNPPPPLEQCKDVEALLGTPMPSKPHASLSSAGNSGGTPPVPWRSPLPQSSHNTGHKAITYARPGEPVNKVYVQFSNDLEGFLPCTLIISEANGLEFSSLCSSPGFVLDPFNIIKVSRIDFDALASDSFFTSLSRSIHQRFVGEKLSSAAEDNSSHPLQERVCPPYHAIVQLSVRRTLQDGGQVLVFIAVQSDPLAEELVQSCHKLKKRRAMRVSNDDVTLSELSSRSIGRGCPTPRTAVCNAARATPRKTCPQAAQNALAMPSRATQDRRLSPIAIYA